MTNDETAGVQNPLQTTRKREGGYGKKSRLDASGRRGFRHGRSDLEHGFYEWACFSAQQGADKAVKAVFQKLGAEAWGHSVPDLPKELGQRRPVPEDLVDAALELDMFPLDILTPNLGARPANGILKERRGD